MSSIGKTALDKQPSDKTQIMKEGFDFPSGGASVWSGFSQPQYDMSSQLLNFPQGHPLYTPQTIAETYSSDSKSLVYMEELVMGFALIGGISVMVVGLLLTTGVVGTGSATPPSSGPPS